MGGLKPRAWNTGEIAHEVVLGRLAGTVIAGEAAQAELLGAVVAGPLEAARG